MNIEDLQNGATPQTYANKMITTEDISSYGSLIRTNILFIANPLVGITILVILALVFVYNRCIKPKLDGQKQIQVEDEYL
ncbi:hypothetical protein THOM_1410 [Trachipleistophora hominis]|uniref:Uncharacterized protein n=1 Tax=Trachipleistophora hominis TaxID=72359 RepID=L7JW31_TRAHO|nr:hypothetical protein THOM_1410 [Trachipleistophora hominis]